MPQIEDRSASTSGPDDVLIMPGHEGTQRIPVNMYGTDEALVIVAPMPGVRADDVDIIVEDGHLTMRAQLRAPASNKHYVMHEWEYGDYERVLDLPDEYSGELTASLGNGQLAISVSRQGERAEQGRSVVHPNART